LQEGLVIKTNRFTEEQIIGVLKFQEKSMKVSDISRQYGIAEQTFYRWKSKYGGMEISEAKRLKQLEEENRRLKQLVGEQALDNQGLKYIIEKNQ
jgi:putative transposase